MKKFKTARVAVLLLIIIGLLIPIHGILADDVEDKSDILKITEINVRKRMADDTLQTIEEDEVLDSETEIRLDVKFKVPVVGDQPTPEKYIVKGDTAIIQLTDKFDLSKTDNKELPLIFGGYRVGTAFLEDIDGMVVARLVFDGEDVIFETGGEGINNVVASFGADLKYDSSSVPAEGKEEEVELLGKKFTFNTKEKAINRSIIKSGVLSEDKKKIKWTVEFDAVYDTLAKEKANIAGYEFIDDLKNVGKYISESFMIDNQVITPTVVPTGVGDDTILKYTFPTNLERRPVVITFETEVSSDVYFSSTNVNVSNTAKIVKDNITIEDSFDVQFKATKWITKSGTHNAKYTSDGAYDPINREIKWTINLNDESLDLNNVTVEDKLAAGLTFVSVVREDFDELSNSWVTKPIANPIDNIYTLGNINTKVKLTIITKIDNPTIGGVETGYEYTSKTYKNEATVRWDGGPDKGSNGVSNNVGVGFVPISKSGSHSSVYGTIDWTVTVTTEKQDIPDLKVVDMLVYGNKNLTTTELAALTDVPEGIDLTKLTQRTNQKFVGTFDKGTSNLVHNVYVLKKDGVPVADLLVVTNFEKVKSVTFKFKSLVTNPDIYANGSSTTKAYNTATLFSGTTKIRDAGTDVSFAPNILKKELLKREVIKTEDRDPSEGVNEYSSNMSEGYDYLDNSVIFRINVNGSSLGLDELLNVNGEKLGAVTITDNLPTGWSFDNIVEGKMFLIYEGDKTSNQSASIRANDKINDNEKVKDILEATVSGNTAEFTFSKLDKPYVILVKARPSEELIKNYFDSNESNIVENTVTLKTEKWTPSPELIKRQQVKIDSTILSKNLEEAKNSSTLKDGEIKWTVDYFPYGSNKLGDRIHDTLPDGLDLRVDAFGNLILEGNIQVFSLTQGIDGKLKQGDPISITVGKEIEYNTTTRTLTFEMPDNAKAYRITYITDVTATTETKEVSNKVVLAADTKDNEEVKKVYVVSEADSAASFERSGWVRVNKVNGLGNALEGTKFALYAADNTTVVRAGTTDVKGELLFKVLQDGTYYLRELEAPEGYILEEITYTVIVKTQDDGKVKTTINGNDVANSNTITVRNYSVDDPRGNLEISKVVTGENADLTKEFDFTVTFNHPSKSEVATTEYEYIGIGVAGGKVKSGQVVKLAHNQKIIIVGLPVDTKYTVTEADYSGQLYHTAELIREGTISKGTIQKAEYTNEFIVELIEYEVTKIWDGGPSLKPSITVQLYRDGDKFGDPAVIATGKNSYKWTNLPKTDFYGKLYNYTVDETDVVGYSKDVKGNVIVNKFIIEETSYTVNKVWVNGPTIKPTIRVQLYQNNIPYAAPVVMLNGETTYTWTKLPKTDKFGVEYEYTVDEVDLVPGYTKTINGNTITNTYVVDKIEYSAVKRWVNGPIVKPEIRVQLMRNGVEYGVSIVLANGRTSLAWTELPKTDLNGVEYTYTVKEVSVPTGYSSSVEGNIITNTFIIEEIDYTVTKIWNNGPTVKPDITIQLLRDGDPQGDPVVLKDGETTHTWTKLPKTDLQGKLYVYTVDELDVEGYAKTIEGSTIVNDYIVEKIDYEVIKQWVNGPTIKPDITIQLFRDGDPQGDPVVLKDGETTYTWEGLPKTDIQGKLYVYTVDELDVEGYTKQVNDNIITNEYIVEETEYTVNKIWKNTDKTRPDITIQLYQNGEPFNESIILKDGELTYTWNNLPKTDLTGDLYTYTVDEINVPKNFVKEVKDNTIINTYEEPKPEIPHTASTDILNENVVYLLGSMLILFLLFITGKKFKRNY